MKRQEFIEYFRILKDLYTKQEVTIEWFKNNFRFSSKINLEEYFNAGETNLTHEGFKEVVFETVTLVREIAIGSNLEEYEKWKKDLIKQDFLTNDDLAHINVISTSNLETIKSINQEILTKRNVSDIDEINAYSVLISIAPRDSSGKTTNFELSKKQLITLIKDLKDSLSGIEGLEDNS